jgi:hypothetical protein
LQSKKKGKHSLGIEKSKGKGSKVFATEESSLKRDNIKSARSTRSQKVESWKYEEGKGRVISSALRKESTSARKEKETEQVISSSSKEYPRQLEEKKGKREKGKIKGPICVYVFALRDVVLHSSFSHLIRSRKKEPPSNMQSLPPLRTLRWRRALLKNGMCRGKSKERKR